jgi:hypothetical protein
MPRGQKTLYGPYLTMPVLKDVSNFWKHRFSLS